MGYNPYTCLICGAVEDNGWDYGREKICDSCFNLAKEAYRLYRDERKKKAYEEKLKKEKSEGSKIDTFEKITRGFSNDFLRLYNTLDNYKKSYNFLKPPIGPRMVAITQKKINRLNEKLVNRFNVMENKLNTIHENFPQYDINNQRKNLQIIIDDYSDSCVKFSPVFPFESISDSDSEINWGESLK